MAYSPVYSVPLILYTAATPNTSFEVPSGYTAVVREFDYYCALGGGVASLSLEAPGSGSPVTFAALNVSGIAATGQWQGRVALPELYELLLDITSLGVGDTIAVSGYLLQNTLS